MKFVLLTLLLAMVAFASSAAATMVAEVDPIVESDSIAAPEDLHGGGGGGGWDHGGGGWDHGGGGWDHGGGGGHHGGGHH